MKHTSFTDIGQFRNVIKRVNDKARYMGRDEDNKPIFDPTIPLPKIKFKGTVKIHGTNAAICLKGDDMWAQSRSNIITPEKDNAGFAKFVEENKNKLKELLLKAKTDVGAEDEDTVTIYGEWCGQGIQKGVAISELDKMFIIFAVKVLKSAQPDANDPNAEVGQYYPCDGLKAPEIRVFNINDYETYEVEVDFAMPQLAQNQIVELVEKVENQCPVAHAMGVDGIGEGIVFTAWWKDERLIFKAKGQRHSVSKVKKIASVDPEVLRNIQEFVDYAVTENRLVQGVQQVFADDPIEIRRMGEFLKWVMGDIAKEETDVLEANNLTMKDVSKLASNKAREWFQKKLNESVGL